MNKKNNSIQLIDKSRKLRRITSLLLMSMILFFSFVSFSVTAGATPPPAVTTAAAGAPITSTADDTFQTVIEFFITWFTRIGLVVSLVGAIMFGLAIKNNDAEQKQAGLMTLIAGLAVAAVCQGADMFGIFA